MILSVSSGVLSEMAECHYADLEGSRNNMMVPPELPR